MTKLVYRNSRLQFSPLYERLRDFIVVIYTMIEEIPLHVMRIEHHLYENYHTTKYLQVRLVLEIGTRKAEFLRL